MHRLLLLFLLFLPHPGSAQIQWMTIEEAAEAIKKEPRKVIIDVYTDWCGWCKRMDQTTFQDSAVTSLINEKFYAVKFNAEGKDTITLGGQSYFFVAQGRRGYHQLAAIMLQGKMSYPSLVYLDENFNMIQPVPGYQTPEQILPILEYFGYGHYTGTPWEEFLEDYKSR